MVDEKALQLFSKILSKTRSRAIHWEQTAEDYVYVATLGTNLVLKLWPFTAIKEGGETYGPPSVGLCAENNTILVDMSQNVDGISTDDLMELAALAKRIALKVDKSMDLAMGRLDELQDEVSDDDIPF
jgi:hypothetical protein